MEFTIQEAINIYRRNSVLYSMEEEKYSDNNALIWLITINTPQTRIYYKILKLSEYQDMEPDANTKQIEDNWNQGSCLILFKSEETGQIVYRVFAPRPSYIIKNKESVKKESIEIITLIYT